MLIRRLSAPVALLLGVFVLATDVANASFSAYGCGRNLCRLNPDVLRAADAARSACGLEGKY